jgi:hypothetical protein
VQDGPNGVGFLIDDMVNVGTIHGGHFENCKNLSMEVDGSFAYVNSYGAYWQGGHADCPGGNTGGINVVGGTGGEQVWKSFGDAVESTADVTQAGAGVVRMIEQRGDWHVETGTITYAEHINKGGCTDRQIAVWDQSDDEFKCSKAEAAETTGVLSSPDQGAGSNTHKQYSNVSTDPTCVAGQVCRSNVNFGGSSEPEPVVHTGATTADEKDIQARETLWISSLYIQDPVDGEAIPIQGGSAAACDGTTTSFHAPDASWLVSLVGAVRAGSVLTDECEIEVWECTHASGDCSTKTQLDSGGLIFGGTNGTDLDAVGEVHTLVFDPPIDIGGKQICFEVDDETTGTCDAASTFDIDFSANITWARP